MKFQIDDYEVTLREGNGSDIIVRFNHQPGLRRAYIEAPEELMHPMYESFFKIRIKWIIESVKRKESISSASRYIPARERETKWKVNSFKREFSQVTGGDIEVIRESWDYNKSPVKGEGKFGDLKGFLEMRKGGSLKLVEDE